MLYVKPLLCSSLWLCTFSLAITVGAALLLPFSIASNEVLLLYPNSYYVKWLNHSLVQGKFDAILLQEFKTYLWLGINISKGLWNHIFLFSNLSLFVLLPFAYFFTESEGFSGHRKVSVLNNFITVFNSPWTWKINFVTLSTFQGVRARLYETITMLLILFVFLIGITYVTSSFIGGRKPSGILSILSR